jgi:hypothetical protein
MRFTEDDKLCRIEFGSMAEMIETVERDGNRIRDIQTAERFRPNSYLGRDVTSADYVRDLAANGWDKESAEVMRLAESAVKTIEAELPQLGFTQEFGHAGAVVDIDRYLTGEPECMIDYPLVEIVRAGRIITLCASVSASSGVNEISLKRRGIVVTALALALSELGYGLEVWADMTANNGGHDPKIAVRTLVKSAGDEIDAARLMYALAHPTMLRVWAMGAMWLANDKKRAALSVEYKGGYGSPHNPIEDLPDGTIYLPCLRSARDVPDADILLRRYLKQLELITD